MQLELERLDLDDREESLQNEVLDRKHAAQSFIDLLLSSALETLYDKNN